MPGESGSCRRRGSRGRRSGSIPTRSASSPTSSAAMRWRPHRAAARSNSPPGAPMGRPRLRTGDRSIGGPAPLRPVLLRSPGGSGTGPGIAKGRPDRRRGRWRTPMEVGPGVRDHLPGVDAGRRGSTGQPRRDARQFQRPPGLAGPLGNRCPRIHRVGDLVAVAAEEGHKQGVVIVPVVPFQPLTAAAPGTALGPGDHPQLLSQRGGIAGRSRADPAGPEKVGADLQVTAKTGELGVLTVPTNLFHDTLPVLRPGSLP